MKALVIILALVGVSFVALLVYGSHRDGQQANDCSHPKAFSEKDPDPDDLGDYCPPSYAEKTRGLQARFAPDLGQGTQTVIVGQFGAGLPVKPGKKMRAAKIKLISGGFVQAAKSDEIKICLCAAGAPIPSDLRDECDSHFKHEHQGAGVCKPDFDSGSLPFDNKGGSLSFTARAPAKVEVR